jgi:hypothetical protein
VPNPPVNRPASSRVLRNAQAPRFGVLTPQDGLPHRDVAHAQSWRGPRVAAAHVLLFCVCISVHGCADSPKGGAVELSWALRDRQGMFEPCDQTTVASIRLDWETEAAAGFDSWPCNNQGEQRGVTGFDVPAGNVSLTISPECAEGPADPASFEAPPPIVRQVELGGIVTLGAVVIEVDLTGSDALPAICAASFRASQRPTSRRGLVAR